jgi:hypothetical protein
MSTPSVEHVLSDAKDYIDWFDDMVEMKYMPPYPVQIYELLADVCTILESQKLKQDYEVKAFNAVFDKLISHQRS